MIVSQIEPCVAFVPAAVLRNGEEITILNPAQVIIVAIVV